MKNFIEERFPVDISFGSNGGPAFSTNVIATSNGQEYRNANWEMPLSKYDISYGVKNQSQLEQLLSFFNICKGRAIGFRFKDWLDYKVVNQQLSLTSHVSEFFQMTKRYAIGDTVMERKITKPVRGSAAMLYHNKPVDPKLYEIDYTTGIVNLKDRFNMTELFISFHFDIPARFDSDTLNVTIESPNSFSCSDIAIVEIRPNFIRKQIVGEK